MDNSQNFNQSQTPSYLIDDYEIERTFTQEYFTEIFYIFLLLTVIIIRFNKNIFKYFLNVVIDIILFLIIEIISWLLTDKVSKYLWVNNLDRFSSKEDIFLVTWLMLLFEFIFSSIFLVIKIISLNKYFKYWWENNNFKNALFKELLKFSLLILLFNLFWYFLMFLKNPTF